MNNTPPLREWQAEALEKYENLTRTNFLLEVTPGGGKTRFAVEVAKRLLARREVTAIVVVVPTARLRKQVAKSFHEHDIELDYDENACEHPLVHGGFCGVVVTYHWVAINASTLRFRVARQNTLTILDEVHHLAEDMPWGAAVRHALEPKEVRRRLLTTGTPFRTDGLEIPFVGYIPHPRGGAAFIADADYRLDYGEALRYDPPIVRSVFFPRYGGTMEWEDNDGPHKVTFDDMDLDEKGRSRRLVTALAADGGHLGGSLRQANDKLMELRQRDPDAGGLIIAMNKVHAKAIARRMRQEFGVEAVVAISPSGSDDPDDEGDTADADLVIEAFARDGCRTPWIVAVKMISEGVDIPRLRVCVYATNVVTEMFFVQAVGRVTRVETGHDDHTAYFYIPDDPRLREWALTIRKQRFLAALSEPKQRKSDSGDAAQRGPEPWDIIGSTTEEKGVYFGEDDLTPAELAIADVVRKQLPRDTWLTREIVAAVGRVYGAMPSRASTDSQTPDVATTGETPDLRTRLNKLRRTNKNLVNRIRDARGGEYRDIHTRLNMAVHIGPEGVPHCADESILQRRIDIARRWLIEGIEP